MGSPQRLRRAPVKEGTFNIGVVDARRQRLIWEDVAISRITEKAYRNREAAIDHAVIELFATYLVPARP